MKTDILIVGGGLGGCAAALAAAEAGRSVVMTEPTDWLGGQVSQQAVPPDENWLIEKGGCNPSYQRYRKEVRDYYRRWFPLTEQAASDPLLNPGGGWVSRLAHLPTVSAAVLVGMSAAQVAAGRLKILYHTEPVSADVQGDNVRSVTVQDQTGEKRTIEATIFIDASETGDLLPITGCEYVTGSEAQSEFDEPHASPKADPLNIQSVTWCFAMTMEKGDHVIDKPDDYAFWREHVPDLTPEWPGKQLSWTYSDPRMLSPRQMQLTAGGPRPGEPVPLWSYRQILNPRIFDAERDPGLARINNPDHPGATLVNWPQNDYMEGSIYEDPKAEHHYKQAKALSRALFYWMQTEAPRPDGGTGYPGLKLRGDLTGTDDGFAKRPYIRESRRIKAMLTITEHHVSRDLRQDTQMGEPFEDSLGIGYYHLDLHPSTGGDNYIDTPSVPFRIPLRSLVPVRLKNLIPACKNIGMTHIANGCYRLHPVEWGIGEAAGVLADAACDAGPVQSYAKGPAAWEPIQKRMQKRGAPLTWESVPAFEKRG